MSSIEIKMKDGTVKNFPHEGRPGGSYSKHIEYKGNFVVVVDEYGKETAFPSEDVKEVKTWPVNW